MRKVIINDSQYNALMEYINEARAATNIGDPTDLSALLADNKDVDS